jgi:hypothetical protein
MKTLAIFFHTFAEAKQLSFNAPMFEPGREQGRSAFQVRSLDLAGPGLAPPLFIIHLESA